MAQLGFAVSPAQQAQQSTPLATLSPVHQEKPLPVRHRHFRKPSKPCRALPKVIRKPASKKRKPASKRRKPAAKRRKPTSIQKKKQRPVSDSGDAGLIGQGQAPAGGAHGGLEGAASQRRPLRERKPSRQLLVSHPLSCFMCSIPCEGLSSRKQESLHCLCFKQSLFPSCSKCLNSITDVSTSCRQTFMGAFTGASCKLLSLLIQACATSLQSGSILLPGFSCFAYDILVNSLVSAIQDFETDSDSWAEASTTPNQAAQAPKGVLHNSPALRGHSPESPTSGDSAQEGLAGPTRRALRPAPRQRTSSSPEPEPKQDKQVYGRKHGGMKGEGKKKAGGPCAVCFSTSKFAV